jgi:hypothetical protein
MAVYFQYLIQKNKNKLFKFLLLKCLRKAKINSNLKVEKDCISD